MYVVVGLGNPGPKYVETRHNVGFEAALLLADKHGFAPLKPWKQSLVSKGTIAGEDVLVALPQTFMNRSGDGVVALLGFYKGDVRRVLVLHDDLDFQPGEVRVKDGGGHGGHNGLRSIIAHIGAEFLRVRIGVGKPPTREAGADFVLSRFGGAERQLIDEALIDAVHAAERIIEFGAKDAMGHFNRRTKATNDASSDLQ